MTDAAFPAIGHIYEADCGEPIVRVAFNADGTTLRRAPSDAEDFETAATTETHRATHIRPGVFMVTRQEEDGITVARVEDVEQDILHAAITMHDRTFLTVKGSWTRLDWHPVPHQPHRQGDIHVHKKRRPENDPGRRSRHDRFAPRIGTVGAVVGVFPHQ